MMFVLSCIHVNHLCILDLYYFLVVVHRGPHGRLAFFFLLNVLPSENKDYYYYYYYYYYCVCFNYFFFFFFFIIFILWYFCTQLMIMFSQLVLTFMPSVSYMEHN